MAYGGESWRYDTTIKRGRQRIILAQHFLIPPHLNAPLPLFMDAPLVPSPPLKEFDSLRVLNIESVLGAYRRGEGTCSEALCSSASSQARDQGQRRACRACYEQVAERRYVLRLRFVP